MCGIVSIARRPGERQALAPESVLAPLRQAVTLADDVLAPAEACAQAATALEWLDAKLRTTDGVATLVRDRRLAAEIETRVGQAENRLAEVESELEAGGIADLRSLEEINAAVGRLKDALWAVGRDRVGTARAVAELIGPASGWAAIEGYTSIQQALAALDRLEVRGRDSGGLSVLVHSHALDLTSPSVVEQLEQRGDLLFRNGTVRVADGHLCFAYKAAAEIGELGDNTRALRAVIADDELLRMALDSDDARAEVTGHTRWASVGIISQANTHPFDSREVGLDGPLVTGAINGDVDNFADLKAAEGLELPPEQTADSKVLPVLVSRRLAAGATPTEAFRSTVAGFEGSVAVTATVASDPDRLYLALRGSGQALYVGLADGAFVVASEPYGVVELTSTYLRLDGETPADDTNPTASRGQLVVLDRTKAGELAGIERLAYDGTPLPVSERDLARAEITTRDIDRGSFAHYLLKEISEAPRSFGKTLRGRLLESGDEVRARLGEDALPAEIRSQLRTGVLRRVQVIGQGTAAVAGRAAAGALEATCADTSLRVEPVLATELSGFGLRADMSDTLVVAISQSGTTTDTNRTVDLVRARGAKVIAIVNRRGSDLTDRVDGVLYTADGRDVEMSVASTKAFYSQVAAGFLLAAAVADEVGGVVDPALLRALRDLPAKMAQVLETRDLIADAARQLAPSRRYWALVGNGLNLVAAAELRIKLSELCYKSIACDGTEDKKHIDLSAEPLILVCAAGLQGSNADDVAKEVAIYRAHKAAPVVIATEGQARFHAALHVLPVPNTHPMLAFVLSAMAGHLFGYEAALSIDALARPLREARGVIESAVAGREEDAAEPAPEFVDSEKLLYHVRAPLEPLARRYLDDLRVGRYDGVLEASTAVRLAVRFRYVLGSVPLDLYELDEGKVGTPAVVIEDLTAALSQAVDELTRPIDAIKHQAKTVTVGISRADETLLTVPLVAEVMMAGAPRDNLTYQVVRTLANISPAFDEVLGYTRYRVENLGPESAHATVGGDDGSLATITVVDQGGVALDLPSRVASSAGAELRGTKHRVALEREVLVARGRSDDRPIVLVPEVKDGQTIGITLLHVRFNDTVSPGAARGVLQGYRNRYSVLHDAVRETEPTFREDLLASVGVVDLLTQPISLLADRWRGDQ